MPEVKAEDISVVAELERMGWGYEGGGTEYLQVRCPAHDDQQPSASINVETRRFKCHAAGCGADGDFITFMALALKSTRVVIMEDLSTRYEGAADKTVDGSYVETAHLSIWHAPQMLRELYKRGLTDETIRARRLGFDKGRITIPVANAQRQWVNVRKYLPGAPSADKMKNLRGHGKTRLYPYDQLDYNEIVVTGGECKALVIAQEMNRYSIGAISVTAGEGSWMPEFSRLFRGKRVWVCMDIDEGGRKAAGVTCGRLRAETKWVGDLLLPLPLEKYPTGDVNDYFGAEQRTHEDFKRLLDACPVWVPPAALAEIDDTSTAQSVTLADSTSASTVARRISLTCIVSQMAETPYIVPKRVAVACNRNQPGCPECPVYSQTPQPDGLVECLVNPESPAILGIVGSKRKVVKETVREALRIPLCKSADFTVRESYNVEDVRLSPQLNISSRESDNMLQPAMFVGGDLDLNAPYTFEGRCYPHPQNQTAILLLSKAVANEDSLGAYAPTAEQLAELTVFQPTEWTVAGLTAKLDELYEDIETNVTRIFFRREMHLAIDLIYHTTLLMKFDGRVVKGWGELLIVGDSSQGKSETTARLMEHYDLGEKVECKNASVAGLLGGLVQSGTKWFVSWGVIPKHDQRLVVLEELKGASFEVISKLTDMRSSGVAEMPKIERRRTHARTRLIAISNPRSDLMMSAHNFGVEVIKELIGGLEDVRRFDLAVIVGSSQIDTTRLNVLAANRPKVHHRHTKELCKRAILWAWTRTPDQVIFTEEAVDSIMAASVTLCDKYTDVLPLCDRGSMRQKLARLAVGLACRTYSCSSQSPETVIVRGCHVDYLVAYLDTMYSDPVFGYDDFSKAVKSTDVLTDPEGVTAKILATPHPADFIDSILYQADVELRDICDWCGWDRGDGLQLLSFLVRKHALMRVERSYRKTPKFIALLKTLKTSDALARIKMPDHIKNKQKF